jgi:hypothetical protein
MRIAGQFNLGFIIAELRGDLYDDDDYDDNDDGGDNDGGDDDDGNDNDVNINKISIYGSQKIILHMKNVSQ